MIISSLEIVNIRSYTKEKINFKEGITFLSGDIGSGKSSLLQAIEFTLFGFKRGDLEGFHILRKGEDKGEVTITLLSKQKEIKITRKLKKTKQGIVQENGFISINSNKEELSPTDLTARIFELLNLPKEFLTKDRNLLYRFSTYTPQEQLKEILYAEHEKRLEIIRKLFQVDKYKQLQGASDLYLKGLRDRKLLLQGKLESTSNIKEEVEELEKELKHFEKEIEQYKEKHMPIKEKISEYKEKKTLIDQKIGEFRVKQLDYEKKYSLLQEYKLQKKILEEEIKTLDEKAIVKEKEILEREVNNQNTQVQLSEKELFEIHKTTLEIQEKLLLCRKKKEEYTKVVLLLEVKKKEEKNFQDLLKKNQSIIIKCRIKDLDVLLNKLRIKISKITKKEEEYNKRTEELKELELKRRSLEDQLKHKEEHLQNSYGMHSCDVCLQDVSIAQKEHIKELLKKQINQIQEELELLLNKGKIVSQTLEVLELEVKEKNSYLVQIETLEEKKQLQQLELDKELQNQEEYKQRYTELQKSIKEVEKNANSSMEKDEKELEQKVKELENSNNQKKENLKNLQLKNQSSIHKIDILKRKLFEKDSREEKIVKLSRSLEKEELLKKSLDKLNVGLISYAEKEDKIKKHLENLTQKDQEISLNIREISTLQISKKELLNSLFKKLEKFDSQKKELQNIEKEYSFLEKKVIPGSSTIEKTLFTKFWVEFNEHFIAIFKELIEDQEFDVYLRDDFSIVVEQNGYEIDISNLSGGEKSSLAVAYRLALKKIIESNLGTQNILDILILDEPTDGFSEQQVSRLGYLLKDSGVTQILLVSHDEKIENIADNILHVEKRNHESRVI